MYNNRQIRKDYLFIVVFISTIIFSIPTLINGFTNVVYGQTNATQSQLHKCYDLSKYTGYSITKSPCWRIEMAYKMFGKGDPIILHNGASDHMDAWDPALLTRLASNHTVIIFDSRGIGNTTSGTEPYSIKLLANDTAGLMDALKIQEANVLDILWVHLQLNNLQSHILIRLAVLYLLLDHAVVKMGYLNHPSF